MLKIAKKLAILCVPVLIYLMVFIYFEPYNYFGLKQNEYTGDSAIARVRNFNQNPADIIILGDSKMAHFDIDKVEEYAKEPVSQLSFGGASINESMDLLEYAIETNPNIHTIYFGASFYTLNESYYKDRMSQIKTISTNPFAYIFNFNYTIEMLNEIKYFILGQENVAKKDEGVWTESDYYYEDGTKRPYRQNLEEYATQVIYPVCENYVLDESDVERYIKLAKMCKEKGIILYTVMPPMDDSLKDLVVDKLGIGKHINYFIDAVNPYTAVLNFEYNQVNPFTEDEFYDGFHLDVVKGLPRYTKMLFER